MILDLRKGFGDFEDYKLTKFPDQSIKLILKLENVLEVKTALRNNDDIITLVLLSDILGRNRTAKRKNPDLYITYMMYQQDDRLFADNESFGLKSIAKIINTLNFDLISVFHPHSDKVEFIDDCVIKDNTDFLLQSIKQIPSYNEMKTPYWIVPDAGAFKTQFKQIEREKYPHFITCLKSRDHKTGDITTIVNAANLWGQDCFIVDDICLGGRTFINIAKELKAKNAGKIYLIVSHGIFNFGIQPLLDNGIEKIFTTDSICVLKENNNLNIYKL